MAYNLEEEEEVEYDEGEEEKQIMILRLEVFMVVCIHCILLAITTSALRKKESSSKMSVIFTISIGCKALKTP
jgi:hypothetical protein